ncbi:MAG: hypothetical protein ACKODX_12015 [Gemmata sp.]
MAETESLFIHAATGNTFPASDPVAWCLENARTPLLGAARDRLLLCSGRTDQDRILNVVLRRCGLNLIAIRPDRVTVCYWTHLADLHQVLKARSLLRHDVQVTRVRRKTGQIALTPGDQLLRGVPIGPAFPFAEYRGRWDRRHEQQPEDALAAPTSPSNYSWVGVAKKAIPWAVLKAVWRQDAVACPNCDVPVLMYRFDWRRSRFFNTHAAAWRACERCGRGFEQPLGSGDPWDWLVSRLGPGLLPATWDGGFGPWDLRRRSPAPRDLDIMRTGMTTDQPASGHI